MRNAPAQTGSRHIVWRGSNVTGLRLPARRRWEPWRDWAVITVLTHASLLFAVLVNPHGFGIVLAAVPLSMTFALGTITVLHDAGHRMFSPRPWVNAVAVQLAAPGGLWSAHWALKHRVHHKYSQIYPYDESTHSSSALRFHTATPVTSPLRYQHVYAWGIYCLAWLGEFRSQLRFLRTGEISGLEPTPARKRVLSFVAEKALFVVVVSGYAWALGIGRFLIFLAIAETFASILVALALVVGHINQGLVASDDPEIAWAENLMLSTASFSTQSTLARWLSGGLSLHLAHHLRPVAVRSELPELHRTVVQQVAARTGLPVVEFPTFRAAVVGHRQRLRELSTSDPATAPLPQRSLVGALEE
jgi:linoleoyl-CoA desaturase